MALDALLIEPAQMNNPDPLIRLSEEAAQMLVDLDEDDSYACKLRFRNWITQSPDHVRAFLLTTVAFREFDRMLEEVS